jgi:uncharacterized protein (DUF488 family)
MYYRRKILLSLLQLFNNELDKISLQKLLFLAGTLQKEPSFHFVPYKYGCFSFQANADLSTLKKYGFVTEEDKLWKKHNEESYLFSLKEHDKQVLKTINSLYGHYTSEDLLRLTYTKFPYYAINSTIAADILQKEDYEKVLNAKPVSNHEALFTIGYEGITIEQYINRLIQNNIAILIDVRRNPLSMKYGFSKTQLKNACEGTGIKYLHHPELGIESAMRKDLDSPKDYDNLFAIYRETTLAYTIQSQKDILELVKKFKRVAITCFEADPCQCHRSHLANKLKYFADPELPVIHL